MMEAFFAKILAGISEELLEKLFQAVVKEIALANRKDTLNRAVDELKRVIEETSKSEASIDEKNDELVAAGRGAINSVRE